MKKRNMTKSDIQKSVKEEKEEFKKKLKAMEKGKERKALKKEYKRYKRIKNRPRRLIIWGIVIALIVIPLGVEYIKGSWPDSPEIIAATEASRLIAESVQAEGTVMLMNEDDVLPLKSKNVNLFGVRTITPSFGGGGSGSIGSENMIGLYTAMEDIGLSPNKDLYNLYSNWGYKSEISTEDYFKKEKKTYLSVVLPNVASILGTENIEDLPASKIPRDVLDNAKAYSDTAVVMLGLSARETIQADSLADQTKETLSLNESDRELIELLNKEFENVVVLLNSGNATELGYLEEYENVKAALWLGFPGEVGFRSIAKILEGEYNPSGRTVDTFAYDSMSSPAAKLSGSFAYDNLENEHFLNYSEGIYVGYRFYETFITDEAGYQKTVQFPFGYGLSYTDFKWETTDFKQDSEGVEVSVKVTNTGKVAGKDVVQIYTTPPYYVNSGIEKSAVELSGFAKTQLLEPNESETLTITMTLEDLASYDYKNTEAFVLEQGTYEVKVARNAHEFVDTKTFDIGETLVYKNDNATGTEITNLFDDANGDIDYLTRSDYQGSLAKIMELDYAASQSSIDALEYKVTPTPGDMPAVNQKNNIKLKDLIGVPYEDEKWQLFLDQFTQKEMIKLVSSAGWKTEEVKRLGVPKTYDVDGPASYGHYFSKWRTVGFPCEVIVATTWNEDLQFNMGESMAQEAALRDVNVWYAPAMNTHRTPFGARNFEYFSEDPLIAGKASSALTRGAYTEGIAVTIKHFALNEQETHRTGVFTWANEQALREIYFKPFEISVKEGKALGAMTAMNRIGDTWCGENPALLNDLLREEWGFRGFVVSDITIGDYMYASNSITNGNDAMLFFTGGAHKKNIKAAYEIDPIGIANGLRKSTHNICYMVANTNAMK